MRPKAGVPGLTTSVVASVDSIGPRADAYSQIGSSNCAGKRGRSRRCPVVTACNGDADRRPAHQKAVFAPVVAARNGDTNRRPAHQEAALGLVVEHRDELGAIVGLAAERLVRDDDRGSRQCSRRDAIEPRPAEW